MKSAVLFPFLALPAVLAAEGDNLLNLVVMAKVDMTSVKVYGKGQTDGEPSEMKQSDYGSEQLCLGDDGSWSKFCANRTPHLQVAGFGFSEKTKDPRPFTIKTSLL
jgi:hypothetical protein